MKISKFVFSLVGYKAVNAENLDSLTYAVRLYKQGDIDEAESVVKKYLMTRPDDMRGWMTLAKMTDDPQVKRRSLERVLAKDPYHKQARDMLNVLMDVMPNITEFGAESRVDALTHKKQEHQQTTAQSEAKAQWSTIGTRLFLLLIVVAIVIGGVLVLQGQGI
jgi:predicted Zn-dependent protease